jgi:hypothetical protein
VNVHWDRNANARPRQPLTSAQRFETANRKKLAIIRVMKSTRARRRMEVSAYGVVIDTDEKVEPFSALAVQ